MLFGLCPSWMAALWANFAGTLHLCPDRVRGRYWLASILGTCGGPLPYYGGQCLGAMQLGSNAAMSLLVIAVEWALVKPALVYLPEVRGLDGLKK
jgi:hypothetical protein